MNIIIFINFLTQMQSISSNAISFLESLPDDIIQTIFSNLDCKSILLICRLSSNLLKFSQRHLDDLLRQSLSKTTGLQTKDYNRRRLLNLSRILPQSKNISAGISHSLILSNDGQTYIFRSNLEVKLDNITTFIPNLIHIIQISSCYEHSLVLSINNQIYAFGANFKGQLGLGDYKNRIIPTLITNITSIIQISAGLNHSLVLSHNGQVYAFGSNLFGKLGLGNYKKRNIATLIPNITNIIQISAGCEHSLALSNTGQIYAFGHNSCGQLGLKDNYERNIPTLVEILISITQISAGMFNSLVISNNDQVYNLISDFNSSTKIMSL